MCFDNGECNICGYLNAERKKAVFSILEKTALGSLSFKLSIIYHFRKNVSILEIVLKKIQYLFKRA